METSMDFNTFEPKTPDFRIFSSDFEDLGHVLRCFLFVETWRDPLDWCPNGQTWTECLELASKWPTY